MTTQTLIGGSSPLTNEQRTFYESTLIERLLPYIPVLGWLKSAEHIADHSGYQAQWRYFAPLPLATAPLAEGEPSLPQNLTITTLTVQPLEYGSHVRMTTLLKHVGIDNVWDETFALLGEQAGRTLHTVALNTLVAGTNVSYANGRAGRSSVAATDVWTATEAKKLRRTMVKNKVRPMDDGYYWVLVSPDAVFDITSDSEFKTPAQLDGGVAKENSADLIKVYTDYGRRCIGGMHQLKFFESQDAPVVAGAGSAGADVHQSLVFGKDAAGIADYAFEPAPSVDPVTNKGMKITGIPCGQPTKDDPHGQIGVAGWLCSFAVVRFQENRLLRFEHGVSS